MVASKPHPTELEITFGIGILFGTIGGFGETKGATPIPTATPIDAITHSSGIANLTFFDMTAKDEKANMLVETGMEIGTSIP